jgi:HEAT repeat protein
VRLGRELLGSADGNVRGVGCDLLGSVAQIHQELREPIATALLALAESETDGDVLWSVAGALGDTLDQRAVPVLVALADHEDSDVRYKVACSLPSVYTGRPEGLEVHTLIQLTRDSDPQVRNWATFGLGSQLNVDTPEVRQALWERAGDDFTDARAEGVAGLAKRRDLRALPLVIDLLQSQDGFFAYIWDAFACLRDARLLPYLEDFDPQDSDVERMLRACDPEVRRRADDLAGALVGAIHTRLPVLDVALYAELYEPGLYLDVRHEERTLTWVVDPLLKRADGDPRRAADLVVAELG